MAEKSAKEKYSGKFRLSLADAESHRMLWTRRFTALGIVVTAVSSLVILGALFFLLVALTPLKTLLPGYPDRATRLRYESSYERLDSLQMKLVQWDIYAENLRKILSGEPALTLDSLKTVSSLKDENGDLIWLRNRDSLLRAQVEGEARFAISGVEKSLPIEAMPFFTPIKGVVSQGFDKSHPYIDVTAPEGSAVMSVLEGTVIFALWDDDEGYAVAVQHSGDLVSVYRHNQKLLKRPGDKVGAGTPIAILGSSESLTVGDHLHFELWYRGTAVDPLRYISF
ncbi:MAG: M23 family metallopeptidase [Bacteroidales bacterium]|nr:M23 family metallopeptidase [Bacteroidales bacterium]